MEKFKLRVEYKNGKTTYTTNLFETEHFKIHYSATREHIRLVMTAAVPITIRKLTVTLPYAFSADSRIFANGYQSWTDCREMFTDDVPSHTAEPAAAVFRHSMLGASGAYSFDGNIKKRGVFSGFSYLYVRNENIFDLFASLNERTGYTLLRANCNQDEIQVEKDLAGVTVYGDYTILDILHYHGTEDDVFERWFADLGVEKPKATPKNGYTTWYNYYPHINENIITNDLDALSRVDAEIDIFQIDDGYQSAVGDWLTVDKKKFPNGMKAQADKIHAKNMLAGIWLAPFGAQFSSKVVDEHPDWLIRRPNGHPVTCGPNWGGFYALDIENPEVRAYIKHFFDVILNDWGFDLVKLDFLYAAAMIPNHGKSRGQLMCEGMDFLRECVGEKMILGCGVPLMPAFGKVDYCRIGADMGLRWKAPTFGHRELVSTFHTLGNTVFRRQLDGRAFLNDPDVFLLRDSNMKCSFEQRKIIATVNKVFGSVLFTSDNVDEYREVQMDLLLQTFRKDKIRVLRAEFNREIRSVLEFEYEENGVAKSFGFDLAKGKII